MSSSSALALVVRSRRQCRRTCWCAIYCALCWWLCHHIVDGSTLTANLGVNPSLTITAQAERALSLWPHKSGVDPRPAQGQPYQRIAAVAPESPVVPKGAYGELR